MLLAFAAPTITLGPASLSIPELAAALTQAGMATEAAPALTDRAAFVRLKGRSPESVRSLLAEALGVAFQAKGAGWRMVVDPAAADRERAFLAAYRRQAVQKAGEWATAQDALRAGRTYAQVDRDVNAAAATFADLKGEPDAATRARLRRLFALSILMNPSVWTGTRLLRDAAGVAASVGGPVTTTIPIARAEAAFGLPAAALGSPDALASTFAFSPQTGLLTTTTRGVFGGERRDLPNYPFTAQIGAYPVAGTGGVAEARVEGVTLTETFNRMGQAAGDYLRGFDPRPALPVVPVAAGPMPPTLSSVLERLDVEAVMELSPRFEGLPVRTMPASISLRDALTIAPLPPLKSEVPAWLKELSRREDGSSLVARNRAFPWRVRAKDGAYLLIDPVAFLDRAQWISPVPTLRVERLLAGIASDAPRDLSRTPLPDWARLETLAAAVEGGSGLVSGYRGVRLESFAPLLPVARLVAALPAPDRATLLRDAARTGGAKVEVGGGTLTLEASLWGSEYGFAKPVARVVGRWTGPTGSAYGEGTLDPKGIF